MKKIILVTGGSGFVGKNLVEQMHGKYTILVPSHEDLDLLNTKRVEEYFQKNKIDVVIHCAMVGGSRKEEFIDNSIFQNLLMFFNIVRCDRFFEKMIQFGSGAEYDKSIDIKKIKEKDFDTSVPQDAYGFYKYVCAKYIEKSKKIFNLRVFGLYGKYEDFNLRFISYAIFRNLKKLPIIINQNTIFDYVYIKDFIKIIDYFILHKPKSKFYNIGCGKKIDLITLANKINKISDFKSKIVIKSKGLNKEYTCNNSMLKNEIKNLKFSSIDESIKDLYFWYKENREV